MYTLYGRELRPEASHVKIIVIIVNDDNNPIINNDK